MSRKPPKAARTAIRGSTHIAIIASRFNQEIVDELLRQCVERLGAIGAKTTGIAIHRVPGAFELPIAAKLAASSGKYAAVICLGAVIRGDTPHFDFVAGEAAHGIQLVALETQIPVIFGVLTTNTEEQARARFDVGSRAADAAIEMAALIKEIQKKSI